MNAGRQKALGAENQTGLTHSQPMGVEMANVQRRKDLVYRDMYRVSLQGLTKHAGQKINWLLAAHAVGSAVL